MAVKQKNSKNKNVTALLELGVEEIPARFLSSIQMQFGDFIKTQLEAAKLNCKSIETYSTPRKVVCIIRGLADNAEDTVEEIIGPPERVAVDPNKIFTQAAIGFAKKQGVELSELTVKAMPNGNYMCITKHIKGSPTKLLLKQIFGLCITKLYVPKAMVWEQSKFKFVRPLRRIVALYGKEIIKLEIAGVQSGRYTQSIFPLYMNKKILIPDADKYVELMKKNKVILDPEQRKASIISQFSGITKKIGAKILTDPGLVDETVAMTENPVAVHGKYNSEFLSLPREVLVTCLRSKQKCFAVVYNHGKLTNDFVGIANGISKDAYAIVSSGFTKVLTARLNDARFFYNNDTKTKLSEKMEKIKSITFHERLGSVYAKMQRTRIIAEWLCTNLNISTQERESVSRIVNLSKNDLTTETVFEYPELQGIMGRLYAEVDGETTVVSQGVEQHYWPLTTESTLPQSIPASIVSIADKVDTMTANFAVGIIPTGSRDPYGLRRISTGIIRILNENGWNLKLDTLFNYAYDTLPEPVKLAVKKDDVILSLMQFMRTRLETMLENSGYKFDEIGATLNSDATRIPEVYLRIEAVKKVRVLPDYIPLSIAYKRAANILRQAREKNVDIDTLSVDTALLTQKTEQDLHSKCSTLSSTITELIEKHEYTSALTQLVSLRGEVDNFFVDVMVMVEDVNLKNNRLALLYNVYKLFYRIADLSIMAEEGKKER